MLWQNIGGNPGNPAGTLIEIVHLEIACLVAPGGHFAQLIGRILLKPRSFNRAGLDPRDRPSRLDVRISLTVGLWQGARHPCKTDC